MKHIYYLLILLCFFTACKEKDIMPSNELVLIEKAQVESCLAAELNTLFQSHEGAFHSIDSPIDEPKIRIINAKEDFEDDIINNELPVIDFTKYSLVYGRMFSSNINNRIQDFQLYYDKEEEVYIGEVSMVDSLYRKATLKFMNYWALYPKLDFTDSITFEVIDKLTCPSDSLEVFVPDFDENTQWNLVEPIEVGDCLTEELNSTFWKGNYPFILLAQNSPFPKSRIFMINSKEEFMDLCISTNPPNIDYSKYTLVCGLSEKQSSASRVESSILYFNPVEKSYKCKLIKINPVNGFWDDGYFIQWFVYPKLDTGYDIFYEIKNITEG